MTLLLILLFLSIIIGCRIAKKTDGDNGDYVEYMISSTMVFVVSMVLILFISLCSPKHSEYNYHTVYANNMDAAITVKANDDSLPNGSITITGGKNIKDITTYTLEQKSEDYIISGTITASKNGGQSTKDFDKLVVKGPKTATKVTKIEYGTEKSCPTLFGIYKFSDGYDTQTNVRVTLSDEKGSKELANLLDGK